MKSKILLNLLWASCWCIGKMPQRLQFMLSDFLFILLYHVIQYRRTVVKHNLSNSFPDKNQKEIQKITIDFYKHLADLFVETLALVSISEAKMREKMIFENPDIVNEISKTRTVLVTMAHFGTWEYTISYILYAICPVLAVYHPLSNKIFDKFYKKLRSRFGTIPVPMAMTAREIIKCIRSGRNPAVALIADQTPPKPLIKNWIDFLNQPTAFFNGTEKLALSVKSAVLFVHMSKVKRGYYIGRFEMIYDGQEIVEEDEITKRYASKLEKMILKDPHLWMWSHRRWKHVP